MKKFLIFVSGGLIGATIISTIVVKEYYKFLLFYVCQNGMGEVPKWHGVHSKLAMR